VVVGPSRLFQGQNLEAHAAPPLRPGHAAGAVVTMAATAEGGGSGREVMVVPPRRGTTTEVGPGLGLGRRQSQSVAACLQPHVGENQVRGVCLRAVPDVATASASATELLHTAPTARARAAGRHAAH
jgi:hypothetical protein